MRRVPTALIAAATLVLGFAVAQLSGVRVAGAAVLLLGVAWCVAREARRAAPWRLVVVVLAGGLCFAASHLLADVLGPWPSVLLVAAALAAVTAGLVDRPRRRVAA
ncbi:hypothetical protein ICW40_04235 [Actinotalea ferrariae]|uniref:hypothetical protein n=1 Tax=Actinotalea ferrariae TaxID=1386098 RepID=UPI001C8CE764|nr:hypothetical protein [Actinotalea ferrariae]MBX9244016.1 hypothetical protein [Actinotalea ferrariae]